MIIAMRQQIDRVVENFTRRHTAPQRLPLALSPRRLYILPTRSGSIFALLLMVMLVGATNYGNSLGFVLTFWFAAIVLVSMHHAHRNLADLRISAVRARPVFAGDTAWFEITLSNPSRRVRRGVHVRGSQNHPGDKATVDPAKPAIVTIAVEAQTRGHLACPRLCVESVYPMGLFRAWSWLQPHSRTLVYPACRGSARWPETGSDGTHAPCWQTPGQEEFRNHRRYFPGDSIRHIDWKASARSDALMVNEYIDPAANLLWFDYAATPASDHETRLAQLTAWVVEAERAGLSYGLKLPGTRLSPDQGRRHRQACLRALALA